MDMEVVGKRVYERRKHAGLLQMSQARQAGIIQGDLSLLERGKKGTVGDDIGPVGEGTWVFAGLPGWLDGRPHLLQRLRPRKPAPVGQEGVRTRMPTMTCSSA